MVQAIDAEVLEEARVVLQAYPQLRTDPELAPLGHGLINETLGVVSNGDRFVLQRVHPIFSAEIHHNIEAVTQALAAAGVPTPRLCPTASEQLWVERHGKIWRLMTRLPGVSFDAVQRPSQARAAGQVLGRFHGALADLDHRFVGMRAGVHDTAKHLANLEDAVRTHRDHRLFEPVERLADALFAAVEALPVVDGVPDRVVHGDPKFNNVLFEGTEAPANERAVGLVDLDTVGPMPLHLELGDAWRSWCNPKGEDDTAPRFDLAIFEASASGWASASTHALSPAEREALVHGVEWITVELAARFLADALRESYFGFDATAYPARGEHNLVRARGQLGLHELVVANRSARARILRAVL